MPGAFRRNAELHPPDYSAAENGVNYKSTTASLAGYFEMMQTLAEVCSTWDFFHASLYPHQIVAALILIASSGDGIPIPTADRTSQQPKHTELILRIRDGRLAL